MSWITITAADVEPRLSDEELTQYRRDFETTGKPDPLAGIITQVTNRIRRAVAKGGGTLGAGATIPDELLHSAIAIIRYNLCTSLPGGLLNDDRRKEYENAQEELADVAQDAAGIVAPTSESTATLTTASIDPTSTESDPPQGERNFQRSNQDGI
jgi:hypothetical protein